MQPAAACLFGYLLAVAAVAAAPAMAASMTEINGDPTTAAAQAELDGSSGTAMPVHLWGPGDGTTGVGPSGGPLDSNLGQLYVVTDGPQQQSALRGSVSGLNVGTIHTLSLNWETGSWETGRPAGPGPDRAFWGLTFHDRAYKPAPSGGAVTLFAPWRQQRFVQDWSAGSRVLPYADAPPMDGLLDTPPESPQEFGAAIDAASVISASLSLVPDTPTIVVLSALAGMFVLFWWLWARVIRPIRAAGQVAPRWPFAVRSGSARIRSSRVLAERGGHVSDHLLEDLTPDW
jgi:hypothetical protein